MFEPFSRRSLIAGGLATFASLPFSRTAQAASPTQIGVDYAYYNPPSLILRKFGWLEESLKPLGTRVEWVLSLGSNKANQFLAAGAVQFGSTAGSAALLARVNGTPIKTVYLYSQPEWTALVVGKAASIKSVAELRGKKVAATRGTDPWFFLLRSLHAVGLTQNDLEVVELQHPDGRTALERGQVDAWAGLDPHMAASELDAGSRLFYRNTGFNTFGALNAREDFLREHPEVVRIVLRAYERARRYAQAHPAETTAILAEASNLEPRVAERQLRTRTLYPSPIPGADYRRALLGVIPIVRSEKLAVAGGDPEGAVNGLIEPAFAQGALHA